MSIKIALAGNPNSGKTTLFNALTGSNQFVGNWPGVTVEKKEGKLKKHDALIIDLPGIYSLSPYTLEEVVARDFLINERPDVILNIVDGTNLERNLYLTTQLAEIGVPMVIAVNMMDVVHKSGDKINIRKLSNCLGCKVIEISALKKMGLDAAVQEAVDAAKMAKQMPQHRFSATVERSISHITDTALIDFQEREQRWYAVKIFERDKKVIEKLRLSQAVRKSVEAEICKAESKLDDDAESIIVNERYSYISSVLNECYKKSSKGLTVSDKIDRIVTNRWLAFPIFAAIMFAVYFVSVSTVGTWATDWANDSLFGDGWHLFGIGASAYEKAEEEYLVQSAIIEAFESQAKEAGIASENALELNTAACLYDDNGNIDKVIPVTYETYMQSLTVSQPDPAEYGVWIPGIPVMIENCLDAVNCADWLKGLILEGIVGGVGAVLGFVPQMLVLFLFLALLEACGYMARIAFVMDRIFRKFGLSGKSFIPMLIGTGCGIPGIMASRTIENERDRRMTIMTTTFIPCGAKLPIIALVAGALFGGAWWVAPSAYFIGIAAIALSGIMLKKTKLFSGDPAPFVMELPAYRWPTLKNVMYSTWERGWSFIKKAGTIILLSSIVLWFLQGFGFENGQFVMVENLNNSLLAVIGGAIAWIFSPLGWGNWQSAVAAITGLIAKENVVGTFGVLFGGFDEVAENGWQIWANMQQVFNPLSAYSFLIFNLLCAPCFAAIGAIKREMNSAKWTCFAICYQCVFAYAVSLIVYQLGLLFMGDGNIAGSIAAFAVLTVITYMLFKPIRKTDVKEEFEEITKLHN